MYIYSFGKMFLQCKNTYAGIKKYEMFKIRMGYFIFFGSFFLRDFNQFTFQKVT